MAVKLWRPMVLYLFRTLSSQPQDHALRVTHISELHQAQLSQLTDTVVGRARLEEELHQAHLLAAKHGAHTCLQNTKKYMFTKPFVFWKKNIFLSKHLCVSSTAVHRTLDTTDKGKKTGVASVKETKKLWWQCRSQLLLTEEKGSSSPGCDDQVKFPLLLKWPFSVCCGAKW